MENQITANFRLVSDRVAHAARAHNRHVRLVAVSKTKPTTAVMAAYKAGARHFGENYIQELVAKANDPLIRDNCSDIKWHFIGRLQTNKVNTLVKTPGLWAVETVTSEKLANTLNSSLAKLEEGDTASKLNVMIQVNTSGEEQKGGAEESEVPQLVRHIQSNCPRLNFFGLMTIGLADVPPDAENPDFRRLVECRKKLADLLGLDAAGVELSMGMSADYEQAIAQGSTSVRVGSTIFGSREYPAAPRKDGAAGAGSDSTTSPTSATPDA